jgi:hypothetical protein
MDDHRMISVSRVYAPNEYSIYLSPADREQFESYEESLVTELQEYLAEHARRESYVLLSSPTVLVNTDADLEVGEFGIATRMVQPEPGQEPDVPEAVPGATMVYEPKAGLPTQAATPEELGVPPEVVTLETDGNSYTIDKQTVVIGRSKDCDIRVADPNVSRRHAEVRQEGTSYWLQDLGSTNGTSVNGRRQQRAKLEHEDRITVGSTELIFRRNS